MGLYKVEINKKVRKKDLPSIAPKNVYRIIECIQNLANNPYTVDAIRLKGRNEWRIRQSD